MWNSFKMGKWCDNLNCFGLIVSNRCFLKLVLYTIVSWSGSKHHPLDFSFIRIIQAGIRNLCFPAIRMFSLPFNWHTFAGVWRSVGKVVCRRRQLSRAQRMATQNRQRFVILDCSDSGKKSYYYKVFAPDTVRLLLRAQQEVCLDLRVSLHVCAVVWLRLLVSFSVWWSVKIIFIIKLKGKHIWHVNTLLNTGGFSMYN